VSATSLALMCALSVAPVARAAASPRPLDGLLQARRGLRVLAGQARSPASRKAVLAAEGRLAGATAPALWIDRSHVLAPIYGQSVFADSRAALVDLERLGSSPPPSGGLASVEGQILAADRGLAAGAIIQALGGPGGLLIRARGMILSGDPAAMLILSGCTYTGPLPPRLKGWGNVSGQFTKQQS